MAEKPVVKWASEQELEQTKQMAADFAFDEERPESPLLILLAGEENTGKTHLACTMKEMGPVYLLDTELRAERVAKGVFGIKTTVPIFNYLEMYAAVKGIIAKYPKGTVVFDSGSDLQKFAEQRFLEEAKLDKIYPTFLWASVWEKCNRPFELLKKAGFNVVVTARMKDEYVNEKTTGKKKPRIYDELPYKADIVVLLNKEKQKMLVKNPYGMSLDHKFTINDTLPSIITKLRGA